MIPPFTESDQVTSGNEMRWFAKEVQPHEAALRAYLKGTYPTVRDVDDVVQESYLRLWKVHSSQTILCARAYLFGIASRFAVDIIRKERRTTAHNVELDSQAANIMEHKADAAEATCTKEEFKLLAEAIHSLPARCREIMVMRKLERLSQQEIADKLGISVGTVEAQLFRGMGKCISYMRRHGVSGSKGENRQ